MFRDSAISKFTIDIDIDIDCTTDCTGSAVKLQRSNNHATRSVQFHLRNERTNVWFPALRFRLSESVNRLRNPCPHCRSVAPLLMPPCTELERKKNSILFERMDGIGKLTETENVIFLRSLRNSYGIRTDKLNSDTHRLERQWSFRKTGTMGTLASQA